MASEDDLKDLYIEELKDLYSAEKQILAALPRMARKATHPALKQAFLKHERQTQGQVRRLERVFSMLGERPGGKKCKGMEGLIEEGKEAMQEHEPGDLLDAALISKAQHVEHYEMAGYGTCRTWARHLGYADQEALLQATLNEEGDTDKSLTALAVSAVNVEAMDPDEDEEEEMPARRRGAAKKGGRKSAAKKGGRKSAAKKGGRKTAKKAAKRARR
jgi:ferritin-like metal-binding protein YciE